MKQAVTRSLHDQPKCPYCGNNARLTKGSEIYGSRWEKLHRLDFWVCENYPNCDALVGCHPGTETPLGRLADRELRRWKIKAHDAFDPLWRTKKMKRQAAYDWLTEQVGAKKQVHIGEMNIEECQKVVEVCTSFIRKGGDPKTGQEK